MSEPLKPEEVVKFGDQVRKIFGWIKKLLKRAPAIIAVAILSYGTFGCDFVRGGIRIINSIPIPEPTEPTPFPTVIPTSTPVATSTPVYTPTPIPTAVATVTPTPVIVGCAGNEFLDVRDSKCKLKPVLVLFKVQGYNPNRPYNCHNPADGPRFYTGKVCVKDSTRIFCDPQNMGRCGPCDSDHADSWNSFCHQRDYDDPRGPYRNVEGAESWWEDSDNPYYTNVQFKPGQPFTICIRPYKDDHTSDGIYLPVHGTASSCVTETYH